MTPFRRFRTLAWAVAGLGVTTHPLVAAVALALALPGRPRRALEGYGLPFALIALVAVLAGALSPRPGSGIVGGLFMAAVVGVLAFAYLRMNRSDRFAVAWGAWAGAMANAVVAGAQVAQGASQAVGFTFHPSFLAAHLALGLGAAGLLVAWTPSRLVRALLILSSLVLLGALMASGSRGGFVGAAAAAAVLLVLATFRISLRRAAWAWLSIGLVVAAAFLGQWMLVGPASRNVVSGSGFERGTYPWNTSSVTTRSAGTAAEDDSSHAMLLASGRQGWDPLLLYGLRLPVESDATYALSYFARPAAGAAEAGAFLRVAALDVAGRVLGRWGREGWSEGDERRAGGRRFLPVEPIGAWRRVGDVLPPLPDGTVALRLMFTKDGGPGTYGLVDAVQLERNEEVTPYVPGRRPGIGRFLGPLVPRLQELVANPVRASGGRISMWWFGLEFASHRPVLGYGVGAEEWLVREQAARFVADPLLHLHSFYLTLLVEGGSALLVAVVMWLALVLRDLARLAWRGSNAALAALGMVVALMVMSAFDQVLGHAYVLVGTWLLVAAVLTGDSDEANAVAPAGQTRSVNDPNVGSNSLR